MNEDNMNYGLYTALTESAEEAERFIKKAELARERLLEDRFAWTGTKETAAAKRASMDLTRALVSVRR